jgi:hypothetical protein
MAGFYTRIVRRSALRAFCLVYENHSVALAVSTGSLFIGGHERLLRARPP